jgi:2-(1,2-epoxy-1,2-dihydrophenyl)acetyl-CoA isomerase
MTFEQINWEVADQVGWIRMDRPDKLNALTSRMAEEMIEALDEAAGAGDVRCVVITGEGRAFCAGQDLTEFRERGLEQLDVAEHLRSGYNRMISAIVRLPKPVVAGVNGVAAGAGLSLACACDVRIASEAAMFMQAFVKIGLVPDSGSTWLLPRIVGPARALELSITGERVDAAEALRIGLVNRVVGAEQFPKELETYAQGMATGATRAIGVTKRVFAENAGTPLAEALEREALAQAELIGSPDFLEGVQAFLDKRPPRFEGR